MTSEHGFDGGSGRPEDESGEGITVRDKRRIDPQTGQVREPQAAVPAPEPSDGAPAGSPSDDSSAGQAEALLAERTADLQRLQAEYVNYKRRVDRDREAVRQNAVASVATALLPVLDDIARARDHAELTGGFKAVAESLQRAVAGLGVEAFGSVGDPFDPRVHEALMHSYADDTDDADGPVCAAVLQVGYRLGDRVLRPARVAVAEPAMPATVGDDAPVSSPEAGSPGSATPTAEEDTTVAGSEPA